MGIRLVQQRRDRIAALEDQPPLVAAHRAVTLLVRDDDFVDLEEVVEQAGLLADFNLAGSRHRPIDLDRRARAHGIPLIVDSSPRTSKPDFGDAAVAQASSRLMPLGHAQQNDASRASCDEAPNRRRVASGRYFLD
jgi:hypothetical protein